MDRVTSASADDSAPAGDRQGELTGQGEQRVAGAKSMPGQVAKLERSIQSDAVLPVEDMEALLRETLADIGQKVFNYPVQSFAPGWGLRVIAATLDVDGRGGRGLPPDRITPRLADVDNSEATQDMRPAIAHIIDQTALHDLFGPPDDPIGDPGSSDDIRQVDPQVLDKLWQGATRLYGQPELLPTRGPGIRAVLTTRTGVEIQLRESSKSGGRAMDVKTHTGPEHLVTRVHLHKSDTG